MVEFKGEVLDDLEVKERYDDTGTEACYLTAIGDDSVLKEKIRRNDEDIGDSEMFLDQSEQKS